MSRHGDDDRFRTLNPQEIAHSITGPCICDPAYTDRGLVQPDCPFCNYADGIAEAIDAERYERCAWQEEAAHAADVLAYAERRAQEMREALERLRPYADHHDVCDHAIPCSCGFSRTVVRSAHEEDDDHPGRRGAGS